MKRYFIGVLKNIYKMQTLTLSCAFTGGFSAVFAAFLLIQNCSNYFMDILNDY